MQLIGDFFTYILQLCYGLLHHYGLTIILFTLLTRILMLPISVMVQKNSIKMVKMYPELNRIRALNYGNREAVSEQEIRLYQKHRYHPMLDLLPVVLQLVILMGVVAAIRNTVAPGALEGADLHFLGFDLGAVPWETKGYALLMPVLAAASSWFMSHTQNRANVLQSEQSSANQWITLIISVVLSLYLGLFVPAGVGFYWVVGNLMSVAQMYLLNLCIDPKKEIDYAALEESRQLLAKVKDAAQQRKTARTKEETAREAADYRRFMAYPARQIVFYAEKNGFYKYYRGVIEEILRISDVTVHYISSDPADSVFDLSSERFRTYYIGENKLIVLMMKMDADIVVLTTPDLQKYHLKRSMVRDDIEYVYMDHAVASANLTLRKHALDAFDTVFATGAQMAEELRAMERLYGLKAKTIVKAGYPLIDDMIASFGSREAEPEHASRILIAPSWQEHNLMDEGLEELLTALEGHGYRITVRPHPQYVRHRSERLQQLAASLEGSPEVELQTDFSSNSTVFDADVLITDWSGIAYEYAFTTLRPVLFVNTPMKVMNPDYEELGILPFDVEARAMVGIPLETDALDTAGAAVDRLLTEEVYAPEALAKVRDRYLYHVGESARYGAGYLLRRLRQISEADSAQPQAAGAEDTDEKKSGFGRRFAASFLFLLWPVVLMLLLAPLEIYAGNKGDLLFGTGDFFWMFFGAGMAACLLGAVILALLPEGLRGFLQALLFGGTLMAYLQDLFLNKQLSKTDGSLVDWASYRSYGIVTSLVWAAVIAALCILYVRKKKVLRVYLGIAVFLCLVQGVAVISLLSGNPYRLQKDTMYVLDSEDELRLAPGHNIIVLILDRYCNVGFDNMLEKTPEAEGIYKDFTFYTNANSKYNYTFPSVIHMLTHVDPDCSMQTGAYKRYAWENGISARFHDTMAEKGFTYRMYTGSGSAIYLDPAYMEGSIDNVKEISGVHYTLHYRVMFMSLLKTSLLRFAPYPLKPYLEIQNVKFNSIVTYDDITPCIDDNGSYYIALKEQGLSVDPAMENALTITHLTGTHNPLTIDEHADPVPDDSVEVWQVREGLNVILEEYFAQLKALGLYDTSDIILMADHGEYLELGNLQPIFLIKPAGQQQERMERTDAPVDSSDFLATMLDLAGEDYTAYGTSVFDHHSGELRERSCAYPNDGFDVYYYTGSLGDLCDKVEQGDLVRMEATEDWE